MRASPLLPQTNCKRGQKCECGKTITLSSSDVARTRQREPWGTSRWFIDYSRRYAVEAANSIVKYHFLALRRHFTRVFGTAKNAFLVAFAVAAANLQQADQFRAQHGLPDIWGDRPPTVTRMSMTRKPRRDRHTRLAIPGPAPPP